MLILVLIDSFIHTHFALYSYPIFIIIILMKNKFFLFLSISAIIVLASIAVFADSSLPPSVNNTSLHSMYTLNDVYNFVVNNTTPGSHDVINSSSPTSATTTVSTSELYAALYNLINPKYIATGITYLGTTGDFGSTTSQTNNLTTSSSSISPTYNPSSPSGYTLEDIYKLISNSTLATSGNQHYFIRFS